MTAPTFFDYDSYANKRGAPLPDAPMVSVVTVTLNAAATLERTVASVHAQTFGSVEHVFVDGGSTDATLSIIRQRIRPQDFWISEPDRGISDAFNKGVALSRGRF